VKVVEGSEIYNFPIHTLVHFSCKKLSFYHSNRASPKQFQADATSPALQRARAPARAPYAASTSEPPRAFSRPPLPEVPARPPKPHAPRAALEPAPARVASSFASCRVDVVAAAGSTCHAAVSARFLTPPVRRGAGQCLACPL
jgi:hypothetical protein